MIAFEDAQQRVLQHCKRLPVEEVALHALQGRVVAQEISSPVDLPGFDNSAMDGFALRLAGSIAEAGTLFDVGAEQAAGDGRVAVHGRDLCWSVMTGACVPASFDTVVPVEQVDVLERGPDGRPLRMRLREAARSGQNIRRAGEDIRAGTVALPALTRVDAAALMLLSGLGISGAMAVRRPRIALICTGRELVDDPLQSLAPGQIRNSNATYLATRIAGAGAQLVQRQTVADDPVVFRAALDRAVEARADIVVSTGAVSMGRFDFVPAVLDAIGATTVFHKVAMRPGKPLLFARMPDGTLYFGLPGNPVSSVVGFRFFVEAAIRALLGLPREQPWRVPLRHDVRKKAGVRLHQKAFVALDGAGRLSVELLPGQESFKTRPLLDATVWAVLPAAEEHLEAGAGIDIYSLGHELGVDLGRQARGSEHEN